MTVAQQVGNAVPVDYATSGGVGDEEVSPQDVADILQRDAQVIDAMCTFSADPC